MLRRIGLFALGCSLFLGWSALSPGLSQAAPPQPPTTTKKKRRGFQFPPIKVPYVQYKPGSPMKKKVFRFKPLLGKKPFVMFYFLPQHKLSLTELRAYATAAKLFAGKVRFFAVTKATTAKDTKAAYAKLKEMKIRLPLLLDEKGLMAYVMLTRRVPAYAMVTKSGRFTLARASSLTEKVDANDTVLSMITKLSRGEETSFTIAPGYSPNPYNLIGRPAIDFTASHVLRSKQVKQVKLKTFLHKDKRPSLLVFWSITCPHCQKTMPLIANYIKKNKKRVKILTLAVIHKDEYRKKLKAYLKEKNIALPVLNDPKGKTFNKYRIMTVPAMFLIDSDGNVRDAFIGGGKNVGNTLDQMLDQLAQQPSLTKPKSQHIPPTKREAAPRKPAPRKATQPSTRPAPRR